MEFCSSPSTSDNEGDGNAVSETDSESVADDLEEVVCSERLGRVTKTYRDIDALTSLLEEKEKDLELAARIGQSLLKQNRALSERNEFLEEQVENATEEVSQLRHEVSMREDLLHLYTSSTESEPVSTTSVPSYKRVFETVKAANQVVRARSRCPSPQNIPGSRAPSRRPSSTPSGVGTPPFGHYESENASMVMLEERTLVPEPEVESAVAAEKMLGTPGTPGSHDLSAALQRLSAQRASHSPDRLSEERASKLPRDGDGSSGFLTPDGSVLSTGTNYSGVSEVSDSSSLSFGSRSYLPEKLQIVKPLEGSATLLHWQQLAKPNMGGILDPRPGVLTKDFQELEIDQEDVYNLNDFEEDDVDMTSFQAVAASTPSKRREKHNMFRSANNLPPTPSTYTITTCRMSNPLQDSTVTTSLCRTVLPSCGSFESLSSVSLEPQRQPPESLVPPGVDWPSSGRDTPMGLVTLLREHGISANTGPRGKASKAGEVGPPAPDVHPRMFPMDWGRTFRSLSFGRALADSTPVNETSNSAQNRSNIFSLNLVEQLRRLGLDQVVERGIVSFQRATEAKKPS
ncbi:hypothetical protein FKM82_028188 [Ascaphus truei]